MLGRAAASISCGRVAALALWLVVICQSPTLLSGQVPAPAKPLATFPMGPDRIPFVTLSFGGKDHQCLIHTGVSTTILHEAVRPELRLAWDKETQSNHALPAASLGSLQLPPGTPVHCHDLGNAARYYGTAVDGIVGTGLLAKAAVTLDFDAGVVVLHGPNHRPQAPGEAVKIVRDPQPATLVRVCDQQRTLAIETGNAFELGLGKTAIDDLCKLGAAEVLRYQAAGGRGTQLTRFGWLSAAGLKDAMHERVLFQERSGQRSDGAIGLHFLARYNPTFLVAQDELVLAKSKWHAGRWWPELRGMTLVDLGDRKVVFSVRRGSAAAKAGVEPNDEIDVPPDYLRCPELWGNDFPLVLRVRRPGSAVFVARLEAREEPTHTGAGSARAGEGGRVVAAAYTAKSDPLASFPLGPDRQPWVTLSYGGRDYQFVLDTGAEVTCFNKRFETELGRPAGKKHGLTCYSIPGASIGALRLPAETVVVCGDLDRLSEAIGGPLDGILGMNVLSQLAVSLNFDEGLLTLHEPGYEPEGPTESIPIYCTPRPRTMVEMAGESQLALIDSGCNGEASLRKDLLKTICTRGDALVFAKGWFVTFYGDYYLNWGCLAEATVWGCRHEQLGLAEWFNDHQEGVLGIQFLARYNATFLFAKSELALSKSKWHTARFWPNLHGMTIANVGGRRIVFSVRPESAAFRAGIRPDDEIDLPADFVSSWVSGLGWRDPLDALTSGKETLGWRNLPLIPLAARQPLWRGHGPLTLRVRKAGETDFTLVRIGRTKLLARSLEATLASWLEERHVPSASVAVVKDGAVVFSKGFGLANLENQIPATEDTPYSMISLSQSFTAAAIMLLVREGRLSLDDRIVDRLPGLPEGWREVTVRHLLNHSSGLKGFESPQDDGQSAAPSALAMLRQVANEPLEFAAGEKHVYCYTNYLLLGLLIEEMAGQTYDQFVTERILVPLGMTRTRPYAGRPDGDCAQRYEWNDKEQKQEAHVELLYPAGLGAFVSTLADLLKWEAALQERSLLDEATLEQMWSLPNRRLMGYGYGWDLGRENGHRLISSGGSSSQIARYIDDRLTVIVLTSGFDGRADDLRREIASLFSAELEPQSEPIEDQDPVMTERLRNMVSDVQQGRIDPSCFPEEEREQGVTACKELQKKITDLGRLEALEPLYDARLEDRAVVTYRASFERRVMMITFWLDAEGQIQGVEPRHYGR